MRSRTHKSGQKKGGGASRAAAATIYRGSLNAGADTRPVVQALSFVQSCSATAAANAWVVQLVFDVSNIASAGRWSSLKTLYEEWRPVSLHVNYYPALQGYFATPATPSTNGIVQGNTISPHVMAPYKGSVTAFTTLANAFDHHPRNVKPINMPNSAFVKMDEADEASWVSTSGTTPGATMGVKCYMSGTCEGATDFNFFGYYVIEYVVQFRIPVATTLQAEEAIPYTPPVDEQKAVVSGDMSAVSAGSSLRGRAVDSLSRASAIAPEATYVVLQSAKDQPRSRSIR
jgi:hypothetical protein